MSRNANYRLGLVSAVISALFLLFGIGALGIIGEGGSNDRMYLAVLAVLVVGSALARLRATGMAVALLATALAQVVVGLVAIARGLHESPGASVPEILMLTAMYAALFSASAWFFHRATEQGAGVLSGHRA